MKLGLKATIRRVAAILATGFVAACFTAPAMAQSVVDAARAALPAKTRDAGVLNVATSYQWAPFAYKSDSGEVVGIDISLVQLLAAKLGLKANFEDMKFPAIVPGVQTGRYDIGVNQMGITEERKKVVDLLPYFNSHFGLLVRKGEPAIDINNLCGKSLALTQGSAQVGIVQTLSDACVSGGKPKIGMTYYPNSADTYLAVANGRGDGFMTNRATGVYTAQKNPKLEMASGTLDNNQSVAGIVIGKGNSELYKALELALESAVSDGSYKALLEKFDVSDGTLTLDQIKAGP
jgi:polar amino acid transport system substrate-binding protein